MRIIAVIGFLAFAMNVWAADPKSDKKSAADHAFDEVLVQGKYHFSDEAVTTVEEDKVLDALIGARKDFKDRIEQSAERY